MFASVTFINDEGGEYGGVEYPPSPSRFVQAIIAGTQGDAKFMPLLQHLESIAPRIYATPDFVSSLRNLRAEKLMGCAERTKFRAAKCQQPQAGERAFILRHWSTRRI
jgi:hypothetical protein